MVDTQAYYYTKEYITRPLGSLLFRHCAIWDTALDCMEMPVTVGVRLISVGYNEASIFLIMHACSYSSIFV